MSRCKRLQVLSLPGARPESADARARRASGRGGALGCSRTCQDPALGGERAAGHEAAEKARNEGPRRQVRPPRLRRQGTTPGASPGERGDRARAGGAAWRGLGRSAPGRPGLFLTTRPSGSERRPHRAGGRGPPAPRASRCPVLGSGRQGARARAARRLWRKGTQL